jgi:tetratricopeptide (TPR) repeat protein
MKLFNLFSILTLIVVMTACGAAPKSANEGVQGEHLVFQAEMLMHQGDFAKAKKILLSYVESIPANWQPRFVENGRQKIHYWDENTQKFCQKIDQEKSGMTVDAIMGESYSKAYFLLGFMAVEEKKYELANSYLDKALILEPDHPGLISEKAAILLNQQDFKLKESLYRRVLDSKHCMADEERARAYRGLGVVLIDLQQLDEAEHALYESLKYEGNHPLAINELNYIDNLRNGGKTQKLQITKPVKK